MTRVMQHASVKWVRMLTVCAPALMLGACATTEASNATAEQALAAANHAQSTADEALTIARRAEAEARSSRTASSEMYQRTLRK